MHSFNILFKRFHGYSLRNARAAGIRNRNFGLHFKEIYNTIRVMDILSLLILSLGLAMDAFAVAVCKGLAIQKLTWKKSCIVGCWFGGFQALMPAMGYVLGIRLAEKIKSIDHWIAFVLLGLIGINMIREALYGKEEDADDSLAAGKMFVMAVATSIDALAVGITFAFLNVHILSAVLTIGVITFAASVIGVKIGNVFGTKFRTIAELVGGLILILLGLKNLIEHLT